MKPKAHLLRKLLWWMEERQRIYLKRQAGNPPPWTADSVLQHYRFCNVYREQDRVTQWIRTKWREPHAEDNNLWFAMCLARQLNWPPTLAVIGYPQPWSARRVLRALQQRQAAGCKVYTSAYLLGGGVGRGMAKVVYTVRHVLQPLYRDYQRRPFAWTTLQAAYEWLCEHQGWGRFLSYEAVTDLRHTRYLSQADDIFTWASVGPGAQRGLNRVYGRELRGNYSQAQLLEELLGVMDWIVTRRDTEILPTLEPRDVEHSLCEFDKYSRAWSSARSGLERFAPVKLIGGNGYVERK